MGDTQRVFVQLARVVDGELDMHPPVIAFVSPTDSWLMTINEFMMSCNDDEVEVEQRPAGLLERCVVLHAHNLHLVRTGNAFEDGKQYILCPGKTEYEAVLRQHGVRLRSSSNDTQDHTSGGDERMTITTNEALESLEELSYYFDDQGTLRHCATNQAVYEIMSDERRAGEIDEVVKAAIFHIQMEMLAELDFKQAHVPIDPRPNEPKEARSRVFLTSDWRMNNNLLIVINGGRGAQPGIWSRDLLIQEGLELGSMLPVFRRAKSCGFSVAVLNPATNSVTIGKDTFPIRSNSSPEEHTLYAWDTIISRSQAQNVYIMAYSFGGKLVTSLLQQREAQVVQRLKGIVFAEGAYHRIDPVNTSPLVGQFLRHRAINFKADASTPVGQHIPSAEASLSCSCLSVGDLSSGGDSSSHCKRSSSNKARTISLCLESAFMFFVAVRDRNCSAPQFIAESETKTQSTWLGKTIRGRLDSLKPRKNKDAPPPAAPSRMSTSSSLPPRSSMSSTPSSHPSALRASMHGSGGSCSRGGGSGSSVSVSDFDLIRVIGKGSIGKVFLVRKVDTHVIYAMKVLRKSSVARHGLEEHIKTERLILEEIDHPFIARLKFSFQTKDKLYLVTDYCSGGELFHHMSDQGFSYDLSQFYAAELVLGLEHLHKLKVAYRDLKPENILVEASGHLRITDFGLSKLNVFSDDGAQTLVGSPEYLAPEVYSMQKYGYAVDWWSLGVFLYEMLTGVHPFFDDNREVMVKKIMTPGIMHQIMPANMPPPAASIIHGLLTFNPTERLGSNGAEEIRRHPFFANIDWNKLFQRQLEPPWKPLVRGDLDVGNFDPEFTSQPVVDSVATQASVIMSSTFANFTFDPSSNSMVRR